MSGPGQPPRVASLAAELKALATGHWLLFRQEMSGKVIHTRQQTIWMAAGAVTALSAILLLPAAVILTLSQALVSGADWSPLIAGGVSSLLVALLFALGGWLIFRSSSSSLGKETLVPEMTLHSLKTAATALTNQPVIPNPIPNAMKTRQSASDALHQTADTVEYQARRAGRAAQDTAQSLAANFNPGAFFSAALAWVDTVLTPGNRAMAGKALGTAAALSRRHPVPAAIVGLGALYVAWQRAKGTPTRDNVEDYIQSKADTVKERYEETRRHAANGFTAAAAVGRDLRESLHNTADNVVSHSRTAASEFGKAGSATIDSVREAYDSARHTVIDGVDRAAETARQLRDDAEAGYRKAREFAREEPALAIAGGVALAIGAVLLVKSSRR